MTVWFLCMKTNRTVSPGAPFCSEVVNMFSYVELNVTHNKIRTVLEAAWSTNRHIEDGTSREFIEGRKETEIRYYRSKASHGITNGSNGGQDSSFSTVERKDVSQRQPVPVEKRKEAGELDVKVSAKKKGTERN